MPGNDPSTTPCPPGPQLHPALSTSHDEKQNRHSFTSTMTSLQSLSTTGGTFPDITFKREQGNEQLTTRHSNADSYRTKNITHTVLNDNSQIHQSIDEIPMQSTCLSFTSTNQQTIHLASVPTQELSSRSIVTLNPNTLNSNCIIPPLLSSSYFHQPNQQRFQPQTVVNSNLNDTKTPSDRDVLVDDITFSSQQKQKQLLQEDNFTNHLVAHDTISLAKQQPISTREHTVNLNFVNCLPTRIHASTAVNSSTGKRNFDTFQSNYKYVDVIGGKPSSFQSAVDSNQTLLQYFANILESRGYSNKYYCSLESGYHCKPTDLQKASYGMKFIEVVRTSNEILLKKLLDTGLSPNPCNNFGESILHMICRRGDHKLLKIFLDYGSSIQICDDFGRTPLHDACWTSNPCFKTVEMLLNKDRWLLHIVDCRGSTPLNYVKKDNWQKWKQFLDRQKDVWWPQRDPSVDGEDEPPALIKKPPHSVPLPDPMGAPSCEYARAIANGTGDLSDDKRLRIKPIDDCHVKTSVTSPRTESALQ